VGATVGTGVSSTLGAIVSSTEGAAEGAALCSTDCSTLGAVEGAGVLPPHAARPNKRLQQSKMVSNFFMLFSLSFGGIFLFFCLFLSEKHQKIKAFLQIVIEKHAKKTKRAFSPLLHIII
jgi:hypothetical protein